MIYKITKALIIRGGGALALLAMSMTITRSLNPTEAGHFFLLLSTIAFFKIFNLFGMHQVSVKIISSAFLNNNGDDIRSISYRTLLTTSVISLVTCLILILQSDSIAVGYWGKPELARPIQISAIVCLFGSVLPLVSHFLQGVGKELMSITLMTLIVPALTTLFIIFFSVEQLENALFVLLLATISTVLLSACLWIPYSRSNIRFGVAKSTNWSTIWITGANLWLVGLLAALSQHGTQIFAGRWLDSAEVSIFAVSMQLKASIALILVAINYILTPKIAALFNEGKLKDIEVLVWKGVLISIIYAMPILFSVAFFSEAILGQLFGPVYSLGATALKILIVGEFVNIFVGPVGVLLSMTNKDTVLRNISIISAIASMFFVVTLVPAYGVVGAAAAVAMSTSLYNILALVAVRRHLGFTTISVWKLIAHRRTIV